MSCAAHTNKTKKVVIFFDVNKSSMGGETYGMNLQIGYKCKNTKDKGYLFAVIGLDDSKEPVKVWVWQKERDPKINPSFEKDAPFYGLYYGGNFD